MLVIMGNCLGSCKREQRDMKQEEDHQQVEEQEASGFEKGTLRVKILVNKEELDWLLNQLREKGGKRLEDVLMEIKKGRGRGEGWKPSLESITEIPEAHAVEVNR